MLAVSLVKEVLLWITPDHDIARWLSHRGFCPLINQSNKEIISIVNSFIVLNWLISLNDIENGVLQKVLLIYTKVTWLLLKKPYSGHTSMVSLVLPFSNLLAIRIVSSVLSGKTKFDSHRNLSRISNSLRNAIVNCGWQSRLPYREKKPAWINKEPTQASSDVAKREAKKHITFTLILFIKFRIISTKQFRFLINRVGGLRNTKKNPKSGSLRRKIWSFSPQKFVDLVMKILTCSGTSPFFVICCCWWCLNKKQWVYYIYSKKTDVTFSWLISAILSFSIKNLLAWKKSR